MPVPDPTPLRDVVEAIIRGSHLALLKRDVDPKWLAKFSQELEKRLRDRSLADVTSDFIRMIANTEEAQKKQLTSGIGKPTEYVMTPAMDSRPAALSCIAVGCEPPVAGMLRRAGLRRWANPFDWMTIPPEAVRDCLVDDFSLLLAPDEHEHIPASVRPPGSNGHLCRHTRFSELYGSTIFHVKDPTTKEGYAALERGVIRMREALRGLHGKLLLQVTEEFENTRDVFAETAEFLDRSARGVTLVTIALVEGPPEGPFPEMELAESFGPHRLLRCRPLAGAQGIAYLDPLDEVVMLRGALGSLAL
ncbi:DUF1796 family putative cysteine peptidase [Roseococcus thiosulfatophilus]|uniref:DUF1796 family putative cysteine peptidase n=1 Tax=Roseococcus thiosulfatophilus TaxID=35813 RepID=UPI001A9045A7|nr:DUF1796 family putative cysteine peptidase [Roseococcus thiosulfatophilus]